MTHIPFAGIDQNDVMDIHTPATRRAQEARMSTETKLNPGRSAAAAKMYPSMGNPNGPPSKGVRVPGKPGPGKFQDASAYRVATEQTKKAMRAYPSLATPAHYDARIDGKNPDGSDRVLIRARKDVPR